MANIKKQNDKGQWDVIASGNSGEISVNDPELLQEGEEVVSVNDILKRQKEDIELLKRNVAWLALHGGGGSGGGGGNTPGSSEAPCTLYLNGVASGGEVIVDEANGLQIHLEDLTPSALRPWQVTVTMGGQTIIQTTASYTSPNVFVPLSRFKHLLVNHVGNMSVGASYIDETNGVYGTATWFGSIIEASINFEGPGEVSYNFEDIKSGTQTITYTYSVGILGKYTLIYNVYRDGRLHNTVSYDQESGEFGALNITSTNQTVRRESLNKILGIVGTGDSIDEQTVQGNYIIEAKLQNIENPNIAASVRSSITIQSNTIFVSSLVLSTQSSEPTEVSMSSSINVTFTAFLQNINDFRYDYLVDGIVIKSDGIGYFGQQVSDSISLSNKDWVSENKVITFTIRIKTTGQTKDSNFYIKFIAASNTYLAMDDNVLNHTITDFKAYEYDDGLSSLNFVNNRFLSGSTEYPISSNLRTFNSNSLSTITQNNYVKSLRLSNGAYGAIRNWSYGGNKNIPLSTMLNTGSFTISICYKADYHPDDERTILFTGSVDVASGRISSGISVDVHDVYINNSSQVKLTDSVVNCVDITCERTTTDDYTSTGVVKKVSYIIKVFLDGVLTSVSSSENPISLGDQLYLGGRVFTQGGELRAINMCDCNIYSVKIYDIALDDIQIMTNYINSIVYTNYKDGNPNFDLIPIELKKNFCERDGEKVVSLLYRNGQYTIDFLIDSNTGVLSETALNDYARMLGIPIMMIDVSLDDNWTFNNFVSQQTASSVNLGRSDGRNIYYWDPNGTNQTVLKIEEASIELQGTSTLSDAVKNLNITVPNDTAFIPKSTWFPEQTYTLKADVVDSSHSNNAAIGNFINTVFGYQEEASAYGAAGSAYFPFDRTAVDNVYNSDYKKNQQSTVTLKHTVEGFPVFLIMKFHTTNDSVVSTTPIGIYSFNIGRDAYRNLGFRKLNKLIDKTTGDTPTINNFPYYLRNVEFQETNSNANWIEIDDTTALQDFINMKLDQQTGTSVNFPDNFNSAAGDFWQSDDNILNARYSVRFGEQNKTQPSEYPKFKRFVEYIMQLPVEGILATPKTISGGLIRQQIEGSYDLYTYVQEGQNFVYKKTGQKQAIVTDVNTLPAIPFNEESMYKYFVIALLFGLVDNFGKNSTYRSWGNQTSEDTLYYIDFYDMDTALGGSNQGQLNIYPDCWIKYLFNKKDAGQQYGYMMETFDADMPDKSKTVVSANHSKLWLSLDTRFYRSKSGSTQDLDSVYTQYWYNLRTYLDNTASAFGYNNFTDWFIEEFFIKQTGDCGSLLFNYDYKLKYLLQFKPGDDISTRDLPKLHGRKISYSRDWLKKHVLFLDSVFYWRDSKQSLSFKNNVTQQGSNTIRRTPEALPMATNSPLAVYYTIGNTVQTFAFMQQNTETFIDAGPNASDSDIRWTFTNSPNIIQLGNDETPLSRMNVVSLNFSSTDQGMDVGGYPSVTNLNLDGNKAFTKDFSLQAFEQGEISEIRELNFARTQTNDGGKFPLALVRTDNTGKEYTKYTKLTSINISNSSAISSLSIPNIPLTDLQVRQSSIENFILERQQYIQDTDLTGCDFLKRISLKECNSFTTFNISGLQNLIEVEISNCAGIQEIIIDNCPNLSRVYISGNETLRKVKITNCPSLKKGTGDDALILANGNIALEELDLSNNTNLNTFIFNQSNAEGLKKMDLGNTKVTHLREDTVNVEDPNILNLINFPALENFCIHNNTEIKNIQFTNNQSRAIPLNYTFQNCTNLERVYGHIQINNTSRDGQWGTFYGCSKFSLHGTSTTTWNGKAIKSGNRVKTVWECMTGSSTNANNEYNSVTLSQLFVTGRSVTNIKFDPSRDNLLYMTFYQSNITQFDIYYILAVFALSGIQRNQTIYRSFQVVNPDWNWSNGNAPSRWTFFKCEKITAISETFNAAGGVTYLPAPEDGKDNGWLSPLVNITSFHAPFVNVSVFISAKFFRRNSGNYSSLTQISAFPIHTLSDNDSDFTTPASLSDQMHFVSVAGNVGNFTNVWTNLPALTSLYAAFYGMRAINFDSLVIPSTVTTIMQSFNCTFARGTLDLEKIFPANSPCTSIVYSFIVNQAAPANGGGFSTSPIEMPIKNSTLSHLPKIQHIGYLNQSYGGSINNYSFMGAGCQKVFKETSFPMNITANCPNLSTFVGFFKGASASFATPPQLPGTMFNKNTKLLNVARLFEEVSFEYSLTGNSFANCPNLTNVAYMFAHSVPNSNATRSKLTGYIPYRLFYHGSRDIKKTVMGSNQSTKPGDNFPTSSILSQEVDTTIFNTNITTMTGCFMGCVNLKPYTQTGIAAEKNDEYNPYTWIYNSDTGSWSENTAENKLQSDGSWSYNGDPSTKTSGIKYIEDSNVGAVNEGKSGYETLNYCCAPDLFRYCSNATETSISYVFQDCGLRYNSSMGGQGNMTSAENRLSAGIYGRIPPYLLKPVSRVINLTALFKYCGRLSSVKINNTIYQIPPTFFNYSTGVNNLTETFKGLSFVANTQLAVFAQLTSALNITSIFAMCEYRDSTTGVADWEISNIFSSNTLSRVSGAFSLTDLNLTSSSPWVSMMYINAKLGLRSGVTFKNNFPTSSGKMPNSQDTAYVYGNIAKSRVTDTAIAEVNNNFA